MITPELEAQLASAEKDGKMVTAVVVLKPTVKTKQMGRFVRDMLDRVRAHGGIGSFSIFDKLGSFSVEASPRAIRALDGEKDVWRITPNQK